VAGLAVQPLTSSSSLHRSRFFGNFSNANCSSWARWKPAFDLYTRCCWEWAIVVHEAGRRYFFVLLAEEDWGMVAAAAAGEATINSNGPSEHLHPWRRCSTPSARPGETSGCSRRPMFSFSNLLSHRGLALGLVAATPRGQDDGGGAVSRPAAGRPQLWLGRRRQPATSGFSGFASIPQNRFPARRLPLFEGPPGLSTPFVLSKTVRTRSKEERRPWKL